MSIRIGQGYDAHQLEEGTPLIIGGVSIPSSKGSKGHSDGDVLFHAIVDALLGALALGDIGSHFPSCDEQWEGADSGQFLVQANSLITKKGYSVSNVDATLILQEPRLSPHLLDMRKNIAAILALQLDDVSVKATTTDELGFTGKGEGLAASAVVLVVRKNEN